jgi:hypothetical protein
MEKKQVGKKKKKEEKTKVERFSMLSMTTDDASASAFVSKQPDVPNERYLIFVAGVKRMIMHYQKEKRDQK